AHQQGQVGQADAGPQPGPARSLAAHLGKFSDEQAALTQFPAQLTLGIGGIAAAHLAALLVVGQIAESGHGQAVVTRSTSSRLVTLAPAGRRPSAPMPGTVARMADSRASSPAPSWISCWRPSSIPTSSNRARRPR